MNGVESSADSGILATNPDVEYVVAYAKITESKEDGIVLEGVFFGGLGETLDEANKLARECVNNIRGGAIIPKIIPLTGDCQVIDALYDATENFEKIRDQMIEASDTIQRTQSLRRK